MKHRKNFSDLLPTVKYKTFEQKKELKTKKNIRYFWLKILRFFLSLLSEWKIIANWRAYNQTEGNFAVQRSTSPEAKLLLIGRARTHKHLNSWFARTGSGEERKERVAGTLYANLWLLRGFPSRYGGTPGMHLRRSAGNASLLHPPRSIAERELQRERPRVKERSYF